MILQETRYADARARCTHSSTFEIIICPFARGLPAFIPEVTLKDYLPHMKNDMASTAVPYGSGMMAVGFMLTGIRAETASRQSLSAPAATACRRLTAQGYSVPVHTARNGCCFFLLLSPYECKKNFSMEDLRSFTSALAVSLSTSDPSRVVDFAASASLPRFPICVWLRNRSYLLAGHTRISAISATSRRRRILFVCRPPQF